MKITTETHVDNEGFEIRADLGVIGWTWLVARHGRVLRRGVRLTHDAALRRAEHHRQIERRRAWVFK